MNKYFGEALTESGSLCCSRKAENSTSLSLVVPIDRPCQAGTEGAGADVGSNPKKKMLQNYGNNLLVVLDGKWLQAKLFSSLLLLVLINRNSTVVESVLILKQTFKCVLL